MKNILFIACCLASISVSAQRGFFVQATGGVGTSNTRYKESADNRAHTGFTQAYDTHLEVGYQSATRVISTGIGYMRTGYDIHPFPNDDGKQAFVFQNYVIAPVMLGNRYRMSNRLSYTPAIGAYVAFNVSGSNTVFISNGTRITGFFLMKVPDETYKATFRPVSYFGVARVKFNYEVNPHLSIVCVPTFIYGIDNMRNKEPQWPSGARRSTQYPNQHNYALLLNAGVQWSFAKKKKVDTGVPQ